MIRNIRIDTVKLRNKKYVQSTTVGIKQIKENSKLSFQKLIEVTSEYDDYIDNIYQRMVQQKKASSILIIPQSFQTFVRSKLFKELLRRIFDYMILLEQFENRFKNVASELQLKSGNLMIHESYQLQQKCKEISYVYMGILLSHGESKFIFKDQYFFQTMIYFISQILKENFDEEIYPKVDSELNRIFRTNTFNLIKRRYQQDQVINQYPELQDAKYVSNSRGDQRLISRLKVHKKFRYAAEIPVTQPPSVIKPLNIEQSASKSIYSRSPLIASFFPSAREKLFTFSRQHSVRDKIVSPIRMRHSDSSQK